MYKNKHKYKHRYKYKYFTQVQFFATVSAPEPTSLTYYNFWLIFKAKIQKQVNLGPIEIQRLMIAAVY